MQQSLDNETLIALDNETELPVIYIYFFLILYNVYVDDP